MTFTVLGLYTAAVVSAHGVALVPVFIADVAAVAWPGQFGLDVACYLMLSALWIAWRHRFNATCRAQAVRSRHGSVTPRTIVGKPYSPGGAANDRETKSQSIQMLVFMERLLLEGN